MLAGVISMPSNIFATTGTNVSILFIDKSNKGEVVLIDASNLGTKVKEGKNQKTVLSAEEEQQIVTTFINKETIEDNVHKVLSQRLNDIYDMFGQIPDTLEDVWIDVATNNIEQAMERINAMPQQNPFTIKYETAPPDVEDWDKCAEVLDKKEKKECLLRGW